MKLTRFRAPSSLSWLPMLLAVLVLGCGDHDDGDHQDDPAEEGVTTGATCPTNASGTYDNFGRDFFGTYCLSCHSSKLSGPARNGAPSDHNFDTVEEIRAMREHIDGRTGAGPAATNTSMPKSSRAPTVDERRKLAEWLACNAP